MTLKGGPINKTGSPFDIFSLYNLRIFSTHVPVCCELHRQLNNRGFPLIILKQYLFNCFAELATVSYLKNPLLNLTWQPS
jgi:hypothetical protein